jgi:hypothetical protein
MTTNQKKTQAQFMSAEGELREGQVSEAFESQARIAIQSKKELNAKLAYTVWAYRTGAGDAWEHLDQNTRVAWREVLKFVLEDVAEDLSFCAGCGDPLTCAQCDEEEDEL